MDWSKYNGKYVSIRVKRNGRYLEHHGSFVNFSKFEVCLLNDNNRLVWITKPMQYRDTVEVIA